MSGSEFVLAREGQACKNMEWVAQKGLKDEIQAANLKFMDAFAKQDTTALSMLYTEDCKLMPTGSDVVTGRDGVVAVFGSVMKAGATSVLLEIDEVGPLDASDTCYERSHYTFYDKDKKVFDHGKYVVIWKKVDGTWYLYTDIFNTNTAPSS